MVLRPGQAPDADFRVRPDERQPAVSGTVTVRSPALGRRVDAASALTITDGIWLEAGDVYIEAGVDASGTAVDFTVGAGLEKGRFVQRVDRRRQLSAHAAPE